MKIPHTHFMDCLALSFSPSDLQLTACTHAPKAGLKSKDRQEATFGFHNRMDEVVASLGVPAIPMD